MPLSFDREMQEQWSRWVLAHGLPELPGTDLGAEQSVPVAYWVGPSTAAVLHIRRYRKQRFDDDPVLITDTDIDLFYLVDADWELGGGGGGGWWDEAPLARIAVAADHVNLHGMIGGGGCKALWGEVGIGAAFAEVSQAGTITRRRVEAPVGAMVVCAEEGQPFTVRVLGAQGELLAEVEESAGFEEWWSAGESAAEVGDGSPRTSLTVTRDDGTVLRDGAALAWMRRMRDERA